MRRFRRIGLAGHTPWWPPSTPLFLQLDSARDAADLMAGVTGAVATGHVSPAKPLAVAVSVTDGFLIGDA